MRVEEDVTVIIPYSGSYTYLKYCIAGLGNQIVKPSNYIIVHDDCEELDSAKLGKLVSYNVVKVHVKGNKGNRSLLRNTGIRHASTPWVFMMDEDIIFLDSYFKNLQSVVDIIDNRHVVHGSLTNKNIDITLPEDQVLKNIHGSIKAELNPKTIKSTLPESRWQSFCTGNLLASKQLMVDAGLFDEKITGWGEEDTEMGFRVYKAGGTFSNRTCLRGVHIIKKVNQRERNANWFKNLTYSLEKHKDEPEYVKARQRCLSFSRRYQ